MRKTVVADHFISQLRKGYEALKPAERVKKIRELVAESPDNAKFIQAEFPDFFREAFPPSSSNEGGPQWVPGGPPSLSAKPR